MKTASEHVTRFAGNPILRPADCQPSRGDLVVKCLLNPGAFEYRGRIGLLLRVAEGTIEEKGWLSTPVSSTGDDQEVQILRFRRNDPNLQQTDPRVFRYAGRTYLTTLSHLRLAWSDDGRRFQVDPGPTLVGSGELEEYGLEDARVSQINNEYFITYTAVSRNGHGVGMISTTDWRTFRRHGMIFTIPNKDCALLPRRVDGRYFALHRPSAPGFGGYQIWLAQSPDLIHWGSHRPLLGPREDSWDSFRVGAGAAPIETSQGWLDIYHGADAADHYGLGAVLLDIENPFKLLGRTIEPILFPSAKYETNGFLNGVVFANGQIVRGDRILIYYGAADSVICLAETSIEGLLYLLQQ
jgi:beta-1,2-mannobiose phosphorylase / 1,2-beta-oligomannan phosphorylase